MQKDDFKIIFGNEDNEVSAETLIACLMHTTTIVHEANKTFGDGKKIEVNIKAFQKGSFEVQIELVQSTLEAVKDLFTSGKAGYVADIIGIVGGVYALVNHLKGQMPKEIAKDEDKNVYRITNKKGDNIIITNSTFNFFSENATARRAAERQFEVLADNPKVSSFTFEGGGVREIIDSADFKAASTPLTKEQDFPPQVSVKSEVLIQIIRPSFSADLKWDFIFEGQKLSAKMKDEALLKIIDGGEQFAKGDCMLVDLEVTKFYDEELGAYMLTKDSYKIIRYIEIVKVPRQGNLFDKKSE